MHFILFSRNQQRLTNLDQLQQQRRQQQQQPVPQFFDILSIKEAPL